MNGEEATPLEEQLLPWLLARENALATGSTSHDSPAADPPADLQPRLEGALACIQVLRQVLPRKSTIASAAQTPELPLQSLGRFTIHRELGHGSFGMVFLASDPQL
jgi:serine/threonine protein kinase